MRSFNAVACLVTRGLVVLAALVRLGTQPGGMLGLHLRDRVTASASSSTRCLTGPRGPSGPPSALILVLVGRPGVHAERRTVLAPVWWTPNGCSALVVGSLSE